MFTLLFHLHSPQRQKKIDERKTKVLLGIYKHLGPNSNVMNFFFHTFSLWIPLIHECIGHWSNVLLSWPTLHNRVNSFLKEHFCFDAVYRQFQNIIWFLMHVWLKRQPCDQLLCPSLPLSTFLCFCYITKEIWCMLFIEYINQKLKGHNSIDAYDI